MQLIRTLSNLPRCLIGMEACCGAHHLVQILITLGHDVRLIPPQFVRPFVKSQKNDLLDAEAIGEAVQRPTMRSAVGNGTAFTKGRDLAAWLGLVPRHHSTGGHATLRGIRHAPYAAITACGRTAWGGGLRISRPEPIPTSSSSPWLTNSREPPGPCSSETLTKTAGCSVPNPSRREHDSSTEGRAYSPKSARCNITDDRTVHRRALHLSTATVAPETVDLMRTGPRGFPSWPEALTLHTEAGYIGAAITVRRCWFSSSGDTTTKGRVFLISQPRAGSSRTR